MEKLLNRSDPEATPRLPTPKVYPAREYSRVSVFALGLSPRSIETPCLQTRGRGGREADSRNLEVALEVATSRRVDLEGVAFQESGTAIGAIRSGTGPLLAIWAGRELT